ncbi:hypothetical protein B0H11DRAFT_1935355 [Mycena galericulata]|nr:hypothetical protein B0H11DRAFT_1935355 [Mycena galericulata]
MAINTIIVLQVQNYRKSPSVPGERRIRVSYPRPIVLLASKEENGILEEADNALFRTKQRENRVVAQLNVVNGEVVIRSKEPRGVTLNGRELSIDGEPAVHQEKITWLCRQVPIIWHRVALRQGLIAAGSSGMEVS